MNKYSNSYLEQLWKGLTDRNPTIVVAPPSQEDSNIMSMENAGTGMIGLGGVGAGVSYGGGLANVKARKQISKINPFMPGLEKYTRRFSDAMAASDPKDLLQNYVIEGNRMMNAKSIKGMDGYGFIEKFMKNPYVSMVTKKRFDPEHYGAFKKSPISALTQLEKEIYSSPSNSVFNEYPQNRPSNVDADVLFSQAEQRKQKLLEVLKKKNPNITVEDLWNNPQYKAYMQSLYDAGDKAKLSTKPVNTAGTGLQRQMADTAKKMHIKVKGGVKGLEALPVALQEKILKQILSTSSGKSMANDFARNFAPAIAQYRSLSSTLGSVGQATAKSKNLLRFAQKGLKKGLIGSGLLAGSGLLINRLGDYIDDSRVKKQNSEFISNIKKQLAAA
jgi:hypothetical protein